MGNSPFTATQFLEWEDARAAKYSGNGSYPDLMWIGVVCPSCSAKHDNWCHNDSSMKGCPERKSFWKALGSPQIWVKESERYKDMELQIAMWRASQGE